MLRPLVRRLLALAALSAFLLPVLPAQAQAQTAPKLPVVLVHGWLGGPADFDQMKSRFTSAGFSTYAIQLPGQENNANAKQIKDAVNLIKFVHGTSEVHLVAHSMGGLSSRMFMKPTNLGGQGGAASVKTFTSIGSPHYGLNDDLTCTILPQDLGGQMCNRPGNNLFLSVLNAGDDSPGAARHTSIFNTSTKGTPDEDFLTMYLDGGACIAAYTNPNLSHADAPKDPAVFDMVLRSITTTERCGVPSYYSS